MPSSQQTASPTTQFLLATGWRLAALGTLFVAVGYTMLPDTVVLYRPPWAEPVLGPTTLLTVGRVPALGLGQLGAATIMALGAAGATGWERLWAWAALTTGVKTLLECATLMLPPHGALASAALFATAVPVGAFALAALWWWRKGVLGRSPRLKGRSLVALCLFLGLWAAAAFAPKLL